MHIDIFSGMYTSLRRGDIRVRMLGNWEKIMVDQRSFRAIFKQVKYSSLSLELSHDLHACGNVLTHIEIFSGMCTSLGTGDILVRVVGSWEPMHFPTMSYGKRNLSYKLASLTAAHILKLERYRED